MTVLKFSLSSVLEANARYENSLYGYFLGKRSALVVVDCYVMYVWKKFGIFKAMMNSKEFIFLLWQQVEIGY